jgi:murein DD-endopeptidase MepM/ murein hydrolase activator NlpD
MRWLVEQGFALDKLRGAEFMQGDLKIPRLTKVISLLTAVLLFVVFTSSAFAASVDDLKTVEGKRDTVRQKIREGESTKNRLAAEVKAADRRVNEAQVQLDELEEKLQKTRQVKNEITQKLQALEAELAKSQEQLELAEKRLVKLSAILSERVGNVYKNGEVSFLEVLLGATDFTDFITRARFLQTIISVDAGLVRDIKTTKKAIEDSRAAIEANRDETKKQQDALIAEVERIDALAAAHRAQRNQVQAELNTKQEMIEKIDADRKAFEASEAEFERSANEIRAQLEAARRAAGGAQTVSNPSPSGFIWPVAGRLSSPFGPRWGRLHAGIDIAAPTGTPIAASKAGRVVISSWYGGYGNLIVLDHGGGVETWYGHNSVNSAQVGQSVGQGQVIGRVGSTGNSTGPHLHFEIRLNGRPVNPVPYLP